MKWYMIVVILSFVFNCYSQEYKPPCILLEIKGNKDKVNIDSLWEFEIGYSITNCSTRDFAIDTASFPNIEDKNYESINFKIYYFDQQKGWNLYSYSYGDYVDMRDFTENTFKTLKLNHSYLFIFSLFSYYIIRDKGKYRIYASYKEPLPNKCGYYLQQSKKYVDVIVY